MSLWLFELGLGPRFCAEPRLNVETWPSREQRPRHDELVRRCPAEKQINAEMLVIRGLCVDCVMSGPGHEFSNLTEHANNNKSSKDRTWSAVPDALLGVIS